MKCPDCGAPTDVLETRQRKGTVTRRRQCFNGHRFTTSEIVGTVKDLGKAAIRKALEAYA